MTTRYVLTVLALAGLTAWTAPAQAHCDTLDGPVVGAARKALDSGNVNLVLVWVQDRGRGIPVDELQKIFEEFYQIESPDKRSYGGLGIGLTLARGLIEAQGGRIWAESDGPGAGSTFKVLLPAV